MTKSKKVKAAKAAQIKAPRAGGVGRQLQQMAVPKGLTRDGWDWVVQALDPFHDAKREIRGYPDADCANTVVRVVQGTIDVVAPGAANWDCHIFTSPLLGTSDVYLGSLLNGKFTVDSNPAVQLGLVNIATAAAGGACYIPQIVSNFPDDAGITDLVYKQSRLIAMGIEVVNTTAEMYKQGTVTAYRMPNRAQIGDCYYDDEKKVDLVKEQRSKIACHYNQEPATLASTVVMYNDSIQWEAKHGAYMPVTLNGVDNPIQRVRPLALVTSAESMSGVDASAFMTKPAVDDTNGFATATPNKIAPINTCGLFFTGLSKETTLTLRIKAYMEIAPTTASTELLQCATPSAGFDPKALQMYSVLAQLMPIATWSENNANGEWFKSILKTIRSVLDPIVSGIDSIVPVGGIYSKGADWISNAVDKVGGILPFLP